MRFKSNARTWKSRAAGQVMPARALREQLVQAGDLRNEIGFQNDINILLAALDDGYHVWHLESPLLSPDRRFDDGPPTLTDIAATKVDLWAVDSEHAFHSSGAHQAA